MTKGCGNDEVSDGIKCLVRLQTASSTFCRHSHKSGNLALGAAEIFKDYLKV
ncbi:hypothetical protein [Neisseria polysaccharea]|uniref:hypothetical protein n=1 Tax=Neisseria polysaccharea TaxID=489 RepID=UPI0027DF8034|nr:hypothetical protein [Neisseria polysaccharea]